ncbi:hypothetical protein ACTMTI_12160 [Nonomuraea sp. H19]|uniref:hypothetical protein n=1 Tax=Nonomuraea sp. H19 TaxID=3452206 RepID=UPI003F89B317
MALLVSMLSAYFAWDSARSSELSAEISRREASRRSVLGVAALTAYLTHDLEGERIPLGGTGQAKKESGLPGPRIDITLKNRGSGEGLIDSYTVKVQRSEFLAGCYPSGGIEKISATYDVPIDTQSATPFAVGNQVRVTVPPGGHTRFRLTLGPVNDDDEVEPWFGVVKVVLHYADGQDLELGPIAVIDMGNDPYFHPDGSTWRFKRSVERSCMRLNARTIEEVTELDDIVLSKEFESLHRALRPYRQA